MTDSTDINFAAAFEVAKKALEHVGRFQTPPTPKIYEVWYRFVEGQNPAIQEQLSHAVEHPDSINGAFLEQLYDQFCAAGSPEADRISAQLSRQIQEVGTLVDSQIEAGTEFGSSVDSASNLLDAGPDGKDMQDCIAQLLESNRKMESQLQNTSQRLQESQTKIDNLRKDLDDTQQKVMTDPLTGVGNRRCFDQLMLRSIEAMLDSGQTSFLVLVDLDEFKSINDNFGHAIGDEVLKYVAAEAKRISPKQTGVARYGGDEFAVFLPLAEPDQVTEYADEVRRSCASNQLTLARSGQQLGRIGLSIGAARLRSDDDVDSWFNRADKLLYRAKESGRNCAMVERSRDVAAT